MGKIFYLHPGVVLKLLVDRHFAIGADAVEDQVNHINLFPAAIGVSFNPDIVAKGPRRNLGQLQFFAQLLANFSPQRLFNAFARLDAAAGERLLAGKYATIVGHFAQQIVFFMLNERADNSPLTHDFSLLTTGITNGKTQFASRLGKPQAKIRVERERW